MFRPRINAVSAILALMFLVLIARLFQLQILHGNHYVQQAENKRIGISLVPPIRGRILDRSGEVLASNVNVFHVWVIWEEVESKHQLATALSETLEIPLHDVLARLDSIESEILQRASDPDPRVMKKKLVEEKRTRHLLFQSIPFHKAALIELDPESFAGVVIEESVIRKYPHGRHAAHVLGYVKKMDSGEYKTLAAEGFFKRNLIDIVGPEHYARLESRNAFVNTIVGATGVERTYNERLSGTFGARIIERDVLNRSHAILLDSPPRSGADLRLTIDGRLQKAAEEALGERPGAAVVMDIFTGEILALASSPSYDANFFTPPVCVEEYKKLISDESRPLINRAIAGVYPIGSLFKVVTASALMEEIEDGATREFECTGALHIGARSFRCWIDQYDTSHGRLSLIEAMEVSCNPFFFEAGRVVGVAGLVKWASLFGFGTPTGIDLPFEAAGLLPNPAWKTMVKGQPWYPGDTLNLSIGQGDFATTPLHVARMMAAVANGGFLVTPRVASADEHQLPPVTIGISPDTLAILRQSLQAVVHGEYGTARQTPLASLPVAGKTGTAQTAPGWKDHSWFAGYAPIEKPRISFAVIVEHAGCGADVAAPIAAKLVETYLEVAQNK